MASIGKRRGGRKSGRMVERQSGLSFEQLPANQRRHRMRPVDIVSADELEQIHHTSLKVLEEIGMDFIHEGAKDMLRAAGADVAKDSDRVKFPRELIEQSIATIPEQFELTSRNPTRNRLIGKDCFVMAPVASAPNSHSRAGGRRDGNKQDYQDFLRMAQMTNVADLTQGYPVEPVDIHASVRHLHCISDFIRLTDKPWQAYSLGQDRNLDAIEMCRISHGVSVADFDQKTRMTSVINTSSPLKLDTVMLEGIIQMSARNQLIVLTPFTLSGAMAPVTLAGAAVQQNAEALAGLAFTQIVRPGSPVAYGAFTSNVDMKSGAPAFGTPEYMKTVMLGGQLCRRYKVPYRSSNVVASNTLDAQAAYEAVFSIWALMHSGVNLVKHTFGWMEGGLQASFEKFILDVDLIQMALKFLEPLGFSEEDLAFETIKEVDSTGHFLGTAHTRARYSSAFYQPILSDWRNFETWSETGSPTAYDHAERAYQELLQSYEAPPALPVEIDEELAAFVAKRVEQGGVATDF